MKKKLFGILGATVFALIAGYNVYLSKSDVKLSDLALNNVEALASSNEGGDNNCHRETITWSCLPWVSGSLCYCYL